MEPLGEGSCKRSPGLQPGMEGKYTTRGQMRSGWSRGISWDQKLFLINCLQIVERLVSTFRDLDIVKHPHSQKQLHSNAKKHTEFIFVQIKEEKTQRGKNALYGNDKHQIQQDGYP